ncbi:outer membrane beta-barrel protein [Aliifodinibius sp. S!AR15-10]|uniref:outer membrane protein n=1 Tax=Aliifodinibius sp. S!AR15-10 TaxID=2950437 RepID=UPI002866E6B9|nr:outer membrane beta-barrel protein [Aliifodinibius sp. S!AR15-10]MDR8392258.1 outer membrane beta-barrel protein [Aliifodinibius sp. S!AR15-10]
MDNFKRVLMVLAGVILIGSVTPNQAAAQWGVGASYEIRDEEPKNGFGVRIERGILNKLPIVQLGLRAHFSNFSEENDVRSNGNLYADTEVKDYDFGVTALGGVSIGLLKPYVGLGLGSNTVDLEGSDLPDNLDDSESKIYWNALVGAEISAIPVLKPFVEYRYSDVGESFYDDVQQQNVPSSSNGRVVFGVLLKF